MPNTASNARPSGGLSEELIAARIERLPPSGWYARMMLIVGMAGFFDAFDALTIAFVVPALIGIWHLAPQEIGPKIGLLIAIGYVGQLIGAVILSYVAETFGRLRVLRWSVAIIGVMSIACALSWSYTSLFWFRFIQGLGLGAEVPIAATYMNEFSRASLRGRLIVLFQAIFAFGVMVTAFVSIWVVPHLGWQWMFVIGALPALLAIWLRRLVPESPRWLAHSGHLAEADAAVAKIEAAVTQGGRALPPLPTDIPPIVRETVHWTELFSRAYLGRTVTAWLIAFSTSFLGYGLLVWLPALYRTVYHLPLGQTLQYAFISYFVGLFGALAGVPLIDRFGRKPCYIISFLGAGVPLLALWAVAPPPLEAVVVLASIALFFISILLAAIYVYLPEIYPTRMRALGAGTASAWYRIAAIVGPPTVGFILGGVGIGGVFMAFGAAGIFGAAIVLFFAIETRGQILEAIAR
ncbi:MAG: MFS transporter [Alphaproteobacteria bacterium]|nr:MFS transporter [Alphaproteobacteria bacterium]